MSENRNYQKSQAIVLGLVAGLLVIYYYMVAYKDKEADVLLLIICIIALGSVLFKHVAFYIAWIWMKIGLLLGKVNSILLLSLVYILIVTPIGWLKKIFAPDVNFSSKKPVKTGFVKREHVFTMKDIENTW